METVESNGRITHVMRTLYKSIVLLALALVASSCGPSSELVACVDAVNVVNANLQTVVNNQAAHDANMENALNVGMNYCEQYCDSRIISLPPDEEVPVYE